MLNATNLSLITEIDAKCYDTLEADGTITGYRRHKGEMVVWSRGISVTDLRLRFNRRSPR